MSTTPIADYALLSDRHSAALVSRDGSIDWLCFPRFDSPSIFGRLLGDVAGHWSIRVTTASQVTRRYLERTMVLETTFRTPTGTVAITDALAMGEGNRGHELGRGAPHLLLRRARCVEGEVELSVEYVPRPEYGLVRPEGERRRQGDGWRHAPRDIPRSAPGVVRVVSRRKRIPNKASRT
jgi:alpha,alpha-trehalase